MRIAPRSLPRWTMPDGWMPEKIRGRRADAPARGGRSRRRRGRAAVVASRACRAALTGVGRRTAGLGRRRGRRSVSRQRPERAGGYASRRRIPCHGGELRADRTIRHVSPSTRRTRCGSACSARAPSAARSCARCSTARRGSRPSTARRSCSPASRCATWTARRRRASRRRSSPTRRRTSSRTPGRRHRRGHGRRRAGSHAGRARRSRTAGSGRDGEQAPHRAPRPGAGGGIARGGQPAPLRGLGGRRDPGARPAGAGPRGEPGRTRPRHRQRHDELHPDRHGPRRPGLRRRPGRGPVARLRGGGPDRGRRGPRRREQARDPGAPRVRRLDRSVASSATGRARRGAATVRRASPA